MTPLTGSSRIRWREAAVAVHVSLFVIGVSWAFGGNAAWVRTPISVWGTLGMVLTAAIVADRGFGRRPRALTWAWPVAALNLVILASCLTPGFHVLDYPGGAMLMPIRVPWWLPSTARATLALHALWLFDGIYLSCLNVALAVSSRRTIRVLLGVAVANAVALSVFGTVQKLVGSTGIYFGAVESPQVYFFASFVYDNHWGAFIVLMSSACIGLILRYAHGSRGSGFIRGPALAGTVAAAILGIAVPYSGSRACTLLLAILLLLAFVRAAPIVSHAIRSPGHGSRAALMAVVFVALAGLAGAWAVAGGVIKSRASSTVDLVSSVMQRRNLGARAVLYRDTWTMARQRVVFGWGMGSYPTVFPLFNTQKPNSDRLPVIYHDAHSDWLQSISEIGLVGTALIGLAVLLPLRALDPRAMTPITLFLLAGCALVAAYAWVEFPFGNVAVVLAWWLLLICAVQYNRLSGPSRAAAAT